MTRLGWWLAALVILGASLVVGVDLLRRLARWLDRRQPDAALSITPPRYVFQRPDEGLATRTRARREKADDLRRSAARKESGTKELPMDNLRRFGQRRERS